MAEQIDYLIQDNNAFIKSVSRNLPEMKLKGFTEERFLALQAAGADLVKKETEQQKAVKLVNEKTNEQNKAIADVQGIIRQIKDAAKSEYGKKNWSKMNLFRIGEKIKNTVKGLSTQAEYMNSLAAQHREMLLRNGLSEEELDFLGTAKELLKDADSEQEDAKKLQSTATQVRDAAAAKVKELMSKTRSFADTCFAKKPEIILQFNAIPHIKTAKAGKVTGEAAVKN